MRPRVAVSLALVLSCSRSPAPDGESGARGGEPIALDLAVAPVEPKAPLQAPALSRLVAVEFVDVAVANGRVDGLASSLLDNVGEALCWCHRIWRDELHVALGVFSFRVSQESTVPVVAIASRPSSSPLVKGCMEEAFRRGRLFARSDGLTEEGPSVPTLAIGALQPWPSQNAKRSEPPQLPGPPGPEPRDPPEAPRQHGPGRARKNYLGALGAISDGDPVVEGQVLFRRSDDGCARAVAMKGTP